MKNNNKISLCGLEFNGLSENDIYHYHGNLTHVVTVNAEFVVKAQKDLRFKSIINENCSTIDGQVPYFLLKLKYPKYPFKKISGCEFIYNLCDKAKSENKRVFLLGGAKESNKLAVINLKNQYEIDIDGYSPVYKPYPFDNDHNNKILKKIELFKPHFLLVGFGAVKQEFWIQENKNFLKKNGVEIVVGVGGTFDFVAKITKRAPRFFQILGIEIFYRLYAEPSKVRIKRIFISLKIFYYFFKIKSK